MDRPLIAPSILAADWGHLAQEVKAIEDAGADWLHLDVMDGHFVPPITFGPDFVRAIRSLTALPLDVHLMIERPENHIEAFAKAGANVITVHYEACTHLHRVVQKIHELGVSAGVALNPATPVHVLESIIEDIQLILIMTVNPGWGGQQFIKGSAEKIKRASKLIHEQKHQVRLEVDGGITDKTAPIVSRAGANVLVAGTHIFSKKGKYKEAIMTLKGEEVSHIL